MALLALAPALAACGSSSPHLTATAHFEMAKADVERLRATATVVRARMNTTLEYAAARVAQAEDAGEFLQFSLIGLGTDTSFIQTEVSRIELAPTRIALATATATRQADIIQVRPIATATLATTASATPSSAASPPQATATGPRFENVVMASGVDRNDCAIDVNPVFTPASTEIYVVAEAYNIPAGAEISSRWHRRGIEVAYFSFEAENSIDGACIWFFIDQTDTAFVAGAWSVELRVDNVALGTPVAFQVQAN
ncbi:MAG: hypothetical protein F4X02_08490 [Chloroflexi bacterium]|nr:hypothetical protein [Chloroflexota bacterium]